MNAVARENHPAISRVMHLRLKSGIFSFYFSLLMVIIGTVASAADPWVWKAVPELWDDGAQGPVKVVPSLSGASLQLGLPEGRYRPDYVPLFVPGDNQWDAHYIFDGTAYAHVPDFWRNPRSFEGLMRFKPDNAEMPQTLMMVSGVFDLRLEPVGSQQVEVVLYLLHQSGVASVRTKPFMLHEWIDLAFGIDGTGRFHVEVVGNSPVYGQLESQSPLNRWNSYSQLFIGSANPTRYARPFHGGIAAMRLDLETDPE